MGIDASTTNTGVVVLDNELNIVDHYLISPDKSLILEDRVVEIFKTVETIFKKYNKEDLQVTLESGSFGSVGKVIDLAMLNGTIYYTVKTNGYDIIKVPPTSWKKVCLGKGNINKKVIELLTDSNVVSFFKDKHKVINDLIDAYHLACFRIK